MSDDDLKISKIKKKINHSKLVLESVDSLFLNYHFSDIILVVAGTKLPAHKVVLASNSNYFRALLYGGLQESQSDIVNLKCDSLESFKLLLKYIYTGKLDMSILSTKQILEIFTMSHEYDFLSLNKKIGNYLISIISTENVCTLYDLSIYYDLDKLKKACTYFLDRNAESVIKKQNFLQLNKNNLKSILERDSFCADETAILKSVVNWIKVNQDFETKDIFKLIRLNLIELDKFIEIIKEINLFSAEEMLEIVYSIAKNKEKVYRCFTNYESNVATKKFGAKIIYGQLECDDKLDPIEEVDSSKISSDLIGSNEESCLLIEFLFPHKINYIQMCLSTNDINNYFYYIDISIDSKNWVRIIDHTQYACQSKQKLYFDDKVVKYLKVVGNSIDNFEPISIHSIECFYDNSKVKLIKGLIAPTWNVATIDNHAKVIEGISRIGNALITPCIYDMMPYYSFTCHELGNGSITVQLCQPYIVDFIRFEVSICEFSNYSYQVFVSTNKKNWTTVANEQEKHCDTWQIIKFDPLPVVFIKIKGSSSTFKEYFSLVKLECYAHDKELTKIT